MALVVFAWLSTGLKIPQPYFMYFYVALRSICMVFNRSKDSWAIFHVCSRGSAWYVHGFQQLWRFLSDISHIFTRLCVIIAWLSTGLKIPERCFTCFYIALHGICMAFNRSEDSWAIFRVFSHDSAWYFHGSQQVWRFLNNVSHVFTWLCVVVACLLTGLTIPEQYFTCFHVTLRGIFIAFNRCEDVWMMFHMFSRGAALYLHSF